MTIVDHDGSDLVSRPEGDAVDSRADREPPRWVRAVLVVVVLLPIVVAVVRALVNDWFPIGDSALLYVRARDVATAHHPLLGSWTSASLSVGEQMNNPGPLYDDLLAPIARTLPFSSAAAIAVGAVNAACVLGISGVSRAVGGWAMQRWMLVACAAMSWVLGSELLIDIWQAHALLLPFLLYLVLMIGLACGEARWLPFAAGVASVLVQTHISYVFVLTAATVAALAVCAARSWPPRDWPWRQALRSRTAAWTAAVVIVCWAQPIWEQLFGRGKGNLARLISNASGGDVQLGPALGVRLSGNVLPQPLWQLRRGFSSLVPRAATVEGDDGPFIDVVSPLIGGPAALVLWLALVLVLAALGWALHRRHARTAAAACWVTTGVVLAAPACLSIVTVGRLFAPHHVRWLWTVAVLVNVVVLWAIAEIVVLRWRRAVTAVSIAPIALATVLSVAALPFLAATAGPRRRLRGDAGVAACVPRARTVARGGTGRLRHQRQPCLRAVQLGGHDAPPGARHRLPRDRRGLDPPARRAPSRRRHRDHAHLPTRARRGVGVRRAGVPGDDRQRARPGRGGSGSGAPRRPRPGDRQRRGDRRRRRRRPDVARGGASWRPAGTRTSPGG